jgi:hypothetical protein
MNTTRRIELLRQVRRINNMLLGSNKTLEEFASLQKDLIDRSLEAIALEALPANYRRRRPRRWSELRPQDQQRLTRKLFRIGANCRARDLDRPLRDMGIRDDDLITTAIWDRVTEAARTYTMRFPRHHGHELPEGTPADRLHAKRLATIDCYRYDIPSDQRRYIAGAEFVPSLHPDDAEWPLTQKDEASEIFFKPVVAADVRRLAEFFPNQRVLATQPYLEDPDTKSAVYYVAYLHIARKSTPRVERCYMGRQWNPETKAWVITERCRSGAAAYTQCHAIFNEAVSRLIHQEAQDGKA